MNSRAHIDQNSAREWRQFPGVHFENLPSSKSLSKCKKTFGNAWICFLSFSNCARYSGVLRSSLLVSVPMVKKARCELQDVRDVRSFTTKSRLLSTLHFFWLHNTRAPQCAGAKPGEPIFEMKSQGCWPSLIRPHVTAQFPGFPKLAKSWKDPKKVTECPLFHKKSLVAIEELLIFTCA